MDIVVKGRNVEVPEHFRQHVADKLSPALRLDDRVFRLDVELFHEKNPRQSAQCQRVEITVRSKGPVIRAEACAETFYAALDAANLKLEARLRKSHDRKRVHHGGKTPPSVAEVTAALPPPLADVPVSQNGNSAAHGAQAAGDVALLDRQDDTETLIVRDKTHEAPPMTTTQALHEMELVGHDFFLFHDADSGLPSVVYRRHGYDYGVLRLAAG
ncbi:MAG: ribosome-associated translation inhibitor RaiA [Mycobacteriales bacterium]|nr:ribosome-associated translation inhibitor RaiA [Mycobacteriales bacterium]